MCPPPLPPNRARSPPPDLGYCPTRIDHNEELAWAIECNFDVSPRSHPRPPPPPPPPIPHGLQEPTSTSTSVSSSPQNSSVISIDEQSVQAAAFDYDISPPGPPIIIITPATDSSATFYSTAADSDTDEAADSDTNEAVIPNMNVTPSSIAVVPPSPSTTEAASSNISGTTTTTASNPVHSTSSIPSKEGCGFCKNARTLLILPEHSTATTHSQELQNPEACQFGNNEDWKVLLSNLEEKDPKDVDGYREWLKGRMELGQGQGQEQVQGDDEPIHVEVFGAVCPFYRRLMMRILDEYAERKKKKEKEKEGSELRLPAAPLPSSSSSSPAAGGSSSTTPTNQAPSNSPTVVSSPASTTPSTTPPTSPHTSSPVTNIIAPTSTTITDNRPEFGFPTPFERQFKAQCRNLSWCQFWEEDDRLLSLHFRSPEGEYEIRRFVDWLTKEGPEVVHGIEVLDKSVHHIACPYHRLMWMMVLGYGIDGAYMEEKAKARVRVREMAREMTRARMGELTVMPVFLPPLPSIAKGGSGSNIVSNSLASSRSPPTVSASSNTSASSTPSTTRLSISTTPATTPPRSPRVSCPLTRNNYDNCNNYNNSTNHNNSNYNRFRHLQSFAQPPSRLRLQHNSNSSYHNATKQINPLAQTPPHLHFQPRSRPCSTYHHLNQAQVHPSSSIWTPPSFVVKVPSSSNPIPPIKKQNPRKHQHPLRPRRHYPDSCVEDLYDPFLQEPSPLQRWINRAQPGWKVLAAVYRSLSRTCQRTVDRSPVTRLYRRFWRDRFGFEEYHVVGNKGVKIDGCDIGRVRDDPRIYGGGGMGQGIDEADTPASQIEVFGRGAQIRRRRFESYRKRHLQAEADESRNSIVGGWGCRMISLARWIVSGSPLVQEVADFVSFFQSHLTDEEAAPLFEQRAYCHPKDDYDYVSSDDDDDYEYDYEYNTIAHESGPAGEAEDCPEGSFLQTAMNPSISLVPCRYLF